MSFTIAIVGRPNVGKSTLFNRLVGRRSALVDDLPGVTRDRREGRARLGDLTFKAIDTNGDGTLSVQEISAAELKVLQTRAGAVRGRLDAEFAKLDTNKDGQLSKAEFMAAAPAGPTTAPNGAPALAQLDKNKDGKVSIDEYRAPRLSVFDKADTNHDGTISTAEQQAFAKARR